ncbi:MAG TPA: IS66 family transposase [Candidatus Sulfotelmatobacter sp.]|nr:IS66 family transposase [Candidatus Sulfotelmatobacter sp.]
MKISTDLFEAFLKCPTKCWLRAVNETGSGNAYAEWVKSQTASYRATEIERLVSQIPNNEFVASPPLESFRSGKWRLALDTEMQISPPMSAGSVPLPECVPNETPGKPAPDSATLQSCLHAVERIPAEGRGRPAQFITIRFIFTNKLGKDDKLLLGFDAFVLSEMLGRAVSLGKIIHGDYHATLKVKVSTLVGEVRKRLDKMAALLTNSAPPDLVLNRHCAECEFQARCRKIAVEKDDLSLLAGMSAKERQKLRSKGIFTVTQLSYTFRPRRRPKRLRDKREKYHHSLKALAIREKKIHIVGSPELKIEGTPVYLDVEGLPDRDFYYLIGLRIGNGDSAVQHSLWADTVGDEGKIWREFLAILETVEKPVLIHYGSYETTFLKLMHERHGDLPEESDAAQVFPAGTNLLSHIFAQIYFSGNSNGLKDTADTLGFKWSNAAASGLATIAWRQQWENSCKSELKARLIAYNTQDCEALNLVADTVRQLLVRVEGGNGSETPSVVRADLDQFAKRAKWQKFVSPVSGFERINSAAHWNYQRDRVYARSGGVKSKPKKRQPRRKFFSRVEFIVMWERSRTCPKCYRTFCTKVAERTRTLQDILFGRHSLKRRLVKYVFQSYHCRMCGNEFGVPERFLLCRKYGWNLVAYFFYQIVELCIPQKTVVRCFNRVFGFDLNPSTVGNLKIKAAQYYAPTKQQILHRIIHGTLIHADETRANIKGKSAFVWVLTSFREVVYIFSDSREGEIVQEILAEFKGVLVSDFYTAYDSIGCPQQRCLIHLMRDLNDEILNNPFDDQLKNIVTDFGKLLKPMIETVDRHGLKRHFLKKHLTEVERFYRDIERVDWQSEAAIKCKDRFDRNRDKLFTFLNYDGIPWNNNNAEHAIKAFARIRDVIGGASTEKGHEEYLTLLSVCQTCKYMGVDFLDFLRSGEKDIYAFGDRQRRRRRRFGSDSAAGVKSTAASVSEPDPTGS